MRIKVVFMILLVLLTGCNSQTESGLTPVTVVLDYTPNTNHTGLFVAIQKGYYADKGLEVRIVQPPEDGAEALVATGKAEFGVSFQDYMAAALSGENKLPIKAIAALVQHNTSGIMSRKGEGIDRPKGMEGKKYATWNLDIEKAIIKEVVEENGGDFSKVNFIPSSVTDEVSTLRTKNVDCIWSFYGWGGIMAEINELETDFFAFKDIRPEFDYYTPVLISNDTYISENPEVVKAFLEAAKQGYIFSEENPEEAAKILLEADTAIDPELCIKSQEWISKEYRAEVEQWGYIDKERWDLFYSWLWDRGLIEEEIPSGTGFINEFLPE